MAAAISIPCSVCRLPLPTPKPFPFYIVVLHFSVEFVYRSWFKCEVLFNTLIKSSATFLHGNRKDFPVSM